ncbi:MAG TPA: NnrU family protein, partial [Caulobacteraceae bacterium]|nr:NnrU family protein [Caulobacteraceae bacterium]
AAAAAFVLIHLLISGTRLRDAITGVIGQGPYMGLFSLASVAALVWLGFAYGGARHGPDPEYWGATAATKWLQLAITLLAFLLAVPGLLTPNPTGVRQEGALDRPDVAKGIVRVTRHPFLWGVVLWAAGHLLVNGDLASLILFGSLLVLAIFGTTSIDAKRRRALGEKWDAFARQTSAVPFAAIAQGRQSLQLGEIGWWKLAVAVAVWAALVWAHPLLFGVSALPGR